MKTEKKFLVYGILIGAGAVGVFALGVLAGTVNKAPASNLIVADAGSPSAPQAAPAAPAANSQAGGGGSCGV